MNFNVRFFLLALSGLLPVALFAQAPVITSLHWNGSLTWSDAGQSNAFYRVEWATHPGGPWYRDADNLTLFHEPGSDSHEVEVPMFHRVARLGGAPPADMVWIEAGDVVLGDGGAATPRYTAHISGFWMDQKEVSKKKWDRVYAWAATNGYTFANTGSGKAPDHPVVNVNWYDCVKWCNARSEMEGRVPVYRVFNGLFNVVYRAGEYDEMVEFRSDNGYRLPTEAEWEKAARGRFQQIRFPWTGDLVTHREANYYATPMNPSFDRSPTAGYHPDYWVTPEPYTNPCAAFDANQYGLFDMAGNVMEFIGDATHLYPTTYVVDPHFPLFGSAGRIRRGGGWRSSADQLQCAARFITQTGGRSDDTGFRCVRVD